MDSTNIGQGFVGNGELVNARPEQTALGLLPMVIGLNINFFTREIIHGAPSTQWWTELSSAIAGGLVIATVLTLVVTPAMLMLGEKRAARGVAGAPRSDALPGDGAAMS